MRIIYHLIVAASLSGCAIPPTKLPVNGLEASNNSPVEDLRPKEEATREVFSLMITNEKYGYARWGEELTSPTGVRLFAHRLYERHAPSSTPRTKIRHFVVYMNNREGLQGFALDTGIAVVLGVPPNSPTQVVRTGDASHTIVNAENFSALSGENEYKRALYSESELPRGTAAFSIYIESESEGKRRFTRTLFPVKPTKESELTPLHQALEAAIAFHLGKSL